VNLFNADLCEALCEVLDVTPSELFELENAPAPKRRKSA
jgi:DNA-binding Xre family transcriptional regulator